jgi:hypothetical protein
MAKKRAAASDPPGASRRLTIWLATHACPRRGCGAAHRVCIEAAERPADDDMFAYRCPRTRVPTGFRFGELKWQTLAVTPPDAIIIRQKRPTPAA